MKTPRVPERVIQSQIVQALRTVGAAVYVLGRPPRHESARMGTGQTPGIPDLYALLPASPHPRPDAWTVQGHGLWIEVKATGGRLRPAQAEFQRLCRERWTAHLVGDLDVVLAYLAQHGYLKAENVPHYRRPA